jgi:hypothetical protein
MLWPSFPATKSQGIKVVAGMVDMNIPNFNLLNSQLAQLRVQQDGRFCNARISSIKKGSSLGGSGL